MVLLYSQQTERACASPRVNAVGRVARPGRGARGAATSRRTTQIIPVKIQEAAQLRHGASLDSYRTLPGKNLPASLESSNAITRGGNCEIGVVKVLRYASVFLCWIYQNVFVWRSFTYRLWWKLLMLVKHDLMNSEIIKNVAVKIRRKINK